MFWGVGLKRRWKGGFLMSSVSIGPAYLFVTSIYQFLKLNNKESKKLQKKGRVGDGGR